jgi:DNA-binding transcriptional MerR regulator
MRDFLNDFVTSSTAARIATDAGYSVADRTIRFWADKGDLPNLRLPSGIRLFLKRDILRVARAKHEATRGGGDAA